MDHGIFQVFVLDPCRIDSLFPWGLGRPKSGLNALFLTTNGLMCRTMFHKNGMRHLIIANRTKCYSILYIRLEYTYSVISVKPD